MTANLHLGYSARQPYVVSGGGGDDLMNGLVAFWKLEEAANTTRVDSHDIYDLDEDGAGNVSQIVGKLGNAAQFPNDTGLLEAVAAPFDFNPDFSIAGWVYASSTGNAGSVICGKWDNAVRPPDPNQNRLQYCMFLSNGGPGLVTLRFHRSTNGTNNVNTTSGNLTQDGWHSFVAVQKFNGSTYDFFLYTNGSAPMQTFGAGAAYTGGASPSKWRIGRDHNGGTYLNGHGVDHVGLWNRALTADDVAFWYNGGSGRDYPFNV